MRLDGLMLSLVVAATPLAHAAPPPRAVIDSCLSAESRGAVAVVAIPTTEYQHDDHYRHGYRASYYQYDGQDVGIAERLRRSESDEVEDDALLFAGTLYPMKLARQPGASHAEALPRIDFFSVRLRQPRQSR